MATSWTPAYDQVLPGASSKVVTAQTNDGLLDAWYIQPWLGVAEAPMTQWLMDEVDYVRPARPTTVWPPSTGQIWPR